MYHLKKRDEEIMDTEQVEYADNLYLDECRWVIEWFCTLIRIIGLISAKWTVLSAAPGAF